MGKSIILVLIVCMLIGESLCAGAPLVGAGADLKGVSLQGGPPGDGRGPPPNGEHPKGMHPGGPPSTTVSSG